MAYFLVLIKIDDLRYLKVYAIMLFSGKVYRFYGEGLQRFEKCLDLEKNCFTDPLNFGFAPLQVLVSSVSGPRGFPRRTDRLLKCRTHL